MALDMGANVDEVDRACRPLRDCSFLAGQDPAQAFFNAWIDAGKKLQKAAEADEIAGRFLSAAEKYRRATIMYITGERMPAHTYPLRIAAYDLLLASFQNI